ncbi:MAG TPA: PaaI family thioesterase [Kofleriaceae bacterium]
MSAEQRVRDSFAKQQAMKTCGIELVRVEPGEVELLLRHSPAITQQHGFVHAGIMATALDSACGYAAFSLMPEDAGVLTIEFKINLMAPARGPLFLVTGTVLKPGRTISVVEGRAMTDGKLIASMTATVMTLVDRGVTG